MKTIVQISPRFTMLPEEWKSFAEGFLWYFILPAFIGYLENIILNLNNTTSLSFQIFVPSVYTVIGIVALLKAQLVSLVKKYVPKNMVTTVEEPKAPEIPLGEATDPNPTVIDTSLLK